jgi:hypothetical protein
VVYLSPTVAGKTHDKKAVDESDLVYRGLGSSRTENWEVGF